jgi:hypothetical protein
MIEAVVMQYPTLGAELNRDRLFGRQFSFTGATPLLLNSRLYIFSREERGVQCRRFCLRIPRCR